MKRMAIHPNQEVRTIHAPLVSSDRHVNSDHRLRSRRWFRTKTSPVGQQLDTSDTEVPLQRRRSRINPTECKTWYDTRAEVDGELKVACSAEMSDDRPDSGLVFRTLSDSVQLELHHPLLPHARAADGHQLDAINNHQDMESSSFGVNPASDLLPNPRPLLLLCSRQCN